MTVRTILLTLCVASAAPLAAQSASDASMSGAAQYARERSAADSLRREILRYATFAGFAAAPCAPGDVRTFEADTAGVVKGLLARLELLVLAHGAGASLDDAAGRALMRAVVRLEGGGPGPRWDTITGDAPRAFNPLLPAELYDSEAKRCVATPGDMPDGIALPDVPGFVVPRDSGAGDFAVAFGPGAPNALRDLLFARARSDSTAVLQATRVTAHAVWGDYAIVGVRRERVLRAAIPVDDGTTGAVYAFRRHEAEWRVIAVVRTW